MICMLAGLHSATLTQESEPTFPLYRPDSDLDLDLTYLMFTAMLCVGRASFCDAHERVSLALRKSNKSRSRSSYVFCLCYICLQGFILRHSQEGEPSSHHRSNRYDLDHLILYLVVAL